MRPELIYAVPCFEFCFVLISFLAVFKAQLTGISSVLGEWTFLWQIGRSSFAQRAPQVKTLNIGLNFRPPKNKTGACSEER